VRFQRPWGELGEIDIGVVLGEDAKSDNSAAFLQVRTNRNGTDYQLALIEFADQQLTGLGLQTAIWDLGFWLEAAYVNGDENYLRLSTGVDYSFSKNTFAQVEYHYNGAGSDDHNDYLSNLGSTPYQYGGVFLLGENYIMPSFSLQLSPLWFLAAQAIVNLDDNSAFLSLSAEYNIAEDFYMDFGYYHFSGDDFSLTEAGLPDFESEYGPNPDTLFVSIRYYF
jgi:predicted porin